MAKIELNNKQLRLIQDALDLFSRIGILQIDRILEHPVIEKLLYERFRPTGPLKVGDHSERGEVVEIGDGFIQTKGHWIDWKDRATPEAIEAAGDKWLEEIRTWTDVDNVKHSIDYSRYHETCDKIKELASEIKNLIAGDPLIQSKHASYGIGFTKYGTENLDAYDMIQVIRHEFWKAQENPNQHVVSSSVTLLGQKPSVKVELDKTKKL